MLKKLYTNRLELQILGVNLKRLIKNLHKNNIDIFNINQINHKEIYLTINAKDLKRIKPFLKDYEFVITKRFGLSYLKDFAIKRLGLCVLIALFFIVLILNNNYLGKIYIYGTKQIESTKITEYLQTFGIRQKTFFNNIDLEELETSLENKFSEISLCSVIKKGTNLLINIKEKIETDLLNSSNIVASENGKIVELSVVQGTAKFKVGDSVKKGEIIIEGYSFNGEEKVECKAIGTVKMKVWYEKSQNFVCEEKVVSKTGNKIVNSYYEIFNRRIKMKVRENNFTDFVKETKSEYLFKNLLIPIKIYKETYYEIKENLIKNDFSLQKDAIIDTIIKETSELVPKDVEILDTKIEISDITGGKIITCYIETIQSL